MTVWSEKKLVVFGDEVGVPLVLECLEGQEPTLIVLDPNREQVHKWLESNGHQYAMLWHPPKDANSIFEQAIAKKGLSLGIIASYSRILWPGLLSLFPLGVVNIHGGKLPEYRGANVLQWALINGETETAVTLHYVDEGVDSGPVIAQKGIRVEEDDTALTLREKMLRASKALLKEWLSHLQKGRVLAMPQDETRARTWPRRVPADGRIDWSWTDERIRNLTRALVDPWPKAFYIDSSGNKCTIDRALTVDEVRSLREKALD